MTLAESLSSRVRVTTAEGDRVTVSASWAESFRASTYGVDLGVRSQHALIAYRSRRDVGFAVEGDLNAEEVRDLTALFRSLGSIFEQFYRGQSEEGLTQTVGLTDAFGVWASLSSLDLDLHVQRSVTGATAGQSVIESAAPSSRSDTPGVASQAATAIPSSSSGTTAPTQLVIPGSGPDLETLAHQLSDALDAVRLGRPWLREFLAQLLERADRQAKERTAPGDEHRAAIAERAREKMVERMSEPA